MFWKHNVKDTEGSSRKMHMDIPQIIYEEVTENRWGERGMQGP